MTWINDLKERYPQFFSEMHYTNFDVGDGWCALLTNLFDQLDSLNMPDFKVIQIKEKFAGLRFYATGATEEAQKLINKAEDASVGICERCGEPGKLDSSFNWMLTLCDSCREKRQKERSND